MSDEEGWNLKYMLPLQACLVLRDRTEIGLGRVFCIHGRDYDIHSVRLVSGLRSVVHLVPLIQKQLSLTILGIQSTVWDRPRCRRQ